MPAELRRRPFFYNEPVKTDLHTGSEWLADFEAAARRPLALRMRYAFIHTHKPVLDERGVRMFNSMRDYRDWCENHLPAWLGYGRV